MVATTVKPLNRAEEYLRWKESRLLVLHTVDVAHVLSDDVGAPGVARRAFDNLEFYASVPLLEQIAHAEALNAAARFPLGDEDLADTLCEMLPENVGRPASARSGSDNGGATMRVETRRVCREDMELHGRCWRCGKPGHHTSICMG